MVWKWNRGADTLVSVFERAAAATPDRVAVDGESGAQTYRQLDAAANGVARDLSAAGAARGGRVAVLLPHDTVLVPAALGILKAGSAVVALDPADPPARLRRLCEDCAPAAIVTDAANRELAGSLVGPGVAIVACTRDARPDGAPRAGQIAPDDAAFLTYTSGTTGRPKGVLRSHRQILASVAAYDAALGCRADDRVPLFASLATGQGSNTILWPLLHGARLCPFALRRRGFTGLAQWMSDRGLTVYASSASIFRGLMRTLGPDQVFAAIRAVRLASEPATGDDLRLFRQHFAPGTAFVTMLSSSETGAVAWSRYGHAGPLPEGVLPLREVAPGVSIDLRGDGGEAVPRGETGQIVVRSRTLALGYWGDAPLSAQRFSPARDSEGMREFRSGDLGRWMADGALMFCGRADGRIKIRGNRVEPAEIEAALLGLAGVAQAAVVAVARAGAEALLCALVVQHPGGSWTVAQLRQVLRASLPPAALPSRIMIVDSLPHTRGTKIDRDALRALAARTRDGTSGSPPRSGTEALLAGIWSECLEVADIGRDDDFFSRGGDSLKAAAMVAEIHAAFGVELNLGVLAEHPTLASLAAFVDGGRGAADRGPIAAVARTPAMPLSLVQARLWEKRLRPDHLYLQDARLRGPLDVAALKASLEYLAGRHEILRTTFATVGGQPAQNVHAASALDFTLADVSGSDDPEGAAAALFRAAVARPADLAALPIVRHVLVRLAEDHHRWAQITHAMLVDGLTARLLERELAMLYEARLAGRPPPLPPLAPLHYVDFAAWQRTRFAAGAPALQHSVAWWAAVLRPVAGTVTRLPLRGLLRRRGRPAAAGTLRWPLATGVARRVDAMAQRCGTTPFVARLAAFAALLAHECRRADIVIGTFYDGRPRGDVQSIAGPMASWVPLVLRVDLAGSFGDLLRAVHGRVFETFEHAEAPFETMIPVLRAMGVAVPATEVTFNLTRDNADRHFGGLAVSRQPFAFTPVPWGCCVLVDVRKPANCELRFDADRMGRGGMQAVVDRYLRLLALTAEQPSQPLAALLAALGRPPLALRAARWSATLRSRLRRVSPAKTA